MSVYRFMFLRELRGKLAQLKTINSTESAREFDSRSKDTKPRLRGCFQPDD
jgi:hypothetical protein